MLDKHSPRRVTMGKPSCCFTIQQCVHFACSGPPQVYLSCCRICLLTSSSFVNARLRLRRQINTLPDAKLFHWYAGAMLRHSERAPRLQCSQLHRLSALQPLSSNLQLKGLHLAYHLLTRRSRQHHCSMPMHQCKVQLTPVHTAAEHKAVSFL